MAATGVRIQLVFVLVFVNKGFDSYLALDIGRIRAGEFWRLVTYIFVPGTANLLVIAVALISALSRVFPIVDFVEAAQAHVMDWGAWGAICYPLLFAACNILLLPGGVLALAALPIARHGISHTSPRS